MARKYSQEVKLKALGLIAEDVDLKEIVEELDVAYGTLIRWKTELKEGIANGNLTSLLETDELLVARVAEELVEELVEMAPDQTKAIQGELVDIVKGVGGYQELSVELQEVASNLAKKINMLTLTATNNIQIESLVVSLAKLQEAFFNKNVTQVAVFNSQAQQSSTSVDKFKGLQKS